MASPPKGMERIDRRELLTSLPVRIQWLHSFLEFGTDDMQALISGQKYIKAIIPAIVNIVYKKLLKYDITARIFTTRDSRDEGPVENWASEESSQIQNRKMFLRWYLIKLNSDCTRMEYWEYLDKVGMMHVGKGRQNPLHVDYIFLGALLGFIQEALFEAILSHPKLEMHRKIALVKALGKIIWIQNDLMEKWHNSDGAEFRDEAGDETLEQGNDREGYLHGEKILGDDNKSILSGVSNTTRESARSSDSGKTSLGRPIEEATHFGDDVSRCPFSGLARPNPAELERQRATTSRSPRMNGSAPDVRREYHNPGTPRLRLIDGKTVLKENLGPNPFASAE